MKKKIQLTESQLNRIVEICVKNVINEENKEGVGLWLLNAAEELWKVQQSGLIAFTSPSPSSTEKELVDYVKKAEAYAYKAYNLYKSLYER